MDFDTILNMFGNEAMAGDAMRQSKKDVSETGKALEGPGGPFDDMIPAKIQHESGEEEPAALSPGEFVIRQPAVALLGDGDESLGAAMLNLLQNDEGALNEVRSILKKYATKNG